jgi:hypothetical protein
MFDAFMARSRLSNKRTESGANIGFEAKLCLAELVISSTRR